jgi:protein tyrosine phosphatase (PTP) superfamily phosphohydrolase (DUF442 family)
MGNPRKGFAAALACVAAFGLFGACSDARFASVPTAPAKVAEEAPRAASARDPRWAVRIERPGLPNLHEVSDVLYRGAQPKAEGIAELKNMGVRTIVSFRKLHSDRDEIGDIEIGYERIGMNAWNPEEEDIVEFLKIVTDPGRLPVFVHCQHGADRTGLMVAIYRVAVEGWTKEDASKEMREGGFGFHEIWRGIPKFLRRLDVERMKREAGMAPAAE